MELPTLWSDGEGWDTGLNENCQNGSVGFRGSRGDTQGKSCGVAREALTDAVRAATGGYKGPKTETMPAKSMPDRLFGSDNVLYDSLARD